MKSIRLALITLFFLSLGYIAYSQKDFIPGFIILSSNDTISGYIAAQTDNLNCQECLFKESEEDKWRKYSPETISGYRFENGRFYISKSIVTDSISKLVFVEFLVNGKSNLYYYREGEKNKYFVEKDNSELTELIYNEIYFINEYGDEKVKYDERYKGALRYIYRDNPEIYPAINKTHFDHNSLIKISKKYHENVCPDEECIIYAKTTRNKVFFGPKIGLTYSRLKVRNYSGDASDIAMNLGFHFRFIPVKVFYRWNFLIGLEWVNIS